MNRHNRLLHVEGPLALYALGSLLVFFGTLGAWLRFPLSLSLFALRTEGLSLPAWFLLAALVSFFVGILLRSKLQVTLSIFVLIVVPVTFFFLMANNDNPWFVQYLAESTQRLMIQDFYLSEYWPNINQEPSMLLIDAFSSLPDRLAIGFSMMDWGWSLVVAGSFILLLALLASPNYRIAGIAASVATCVVVLIIVTPTIYASQQRSKAEKTLALGNASSTLHYFERALKADAMLRHSREFSLRLSQAYLLLEGQASPRAALYTLSRLQASSLPFKPLPFKTSFQGSLDRLAEAHKALRCDQHNSLDCVIKKQTELEISRMLLVESKLNIQQKNFRLAEALLATKTIAPDRNITKSILRAHIALSEGAYSSGLNDLKPLFHEIGNASVRADIACTIGDLYNAKRDTLKAREYYQQCLELDILWNYRAIKSLAGI